MPVGLLAAAILVVNNVRDIDTDRRAGKRTLAVKLGRERARTLFAAMVAVAFVVPVGIWCPAAVAPGCCWRSPRSRSCRRWSRTVSTRTDGPALNGALAATGRLLAVFSLLLAGGRAALVSARCSAPSCGCRSR